MFSKTKMFFTPLPIFSSKISTEMEFCKKFYQNIVFQNILKIFLLQKIVVNIFAFTKTLMKILISSQIFCIKTKNFAKK